MHRQRCIDAAIVQAHAPAPGEGRISYGRRLQGWQVVLAGSWRQRGALSVRPRCVPVAYVPHGSGPARRVSALRLRKVHRACCCCVSGLLKGWIRTVRKRLDLKKTKPSGTALVGHLYTKLEFCQLTKLSLPGMPRRHDLRSDTRHGLAPPYQHPGQDDPASTSVRLAR